MRLVTSEGGAVWWPLARPWQQTIQVPRGQGRKEQARQLAGRNLAGLEEEERKSMVMMMATAMTIMTMTSMETISRRGKSPEVGRSPDLSPRQWGHLQLLVSLPC